MATHTSLFANSVIQDFDVDIAGVADRFFFPLGDTNCQFSATNVRFTIDSYVYVTQHGKRYPSGGNRNRL